MFLPLIVPVRLLRVGAGSVIVKVAVPSTPSVVAVIVVDPAAFPVATPEELIVAFDVSLLVQVKVLPDISVLLEE